MYLVAGLLRLRDASLTAAFLHTAADWRQPALVLQLVLVRPSGRSVDELSISCREAGAQDAPETIPVWIATGVISG